MVRARDPNDLDQMKRAYAEFAATTDRPTMIVVHSHIGYGSPHKHDSFEAHGEPLGVDEVKLVKKFFNFDPDKSFVVPPGVSILDAMRAHGHEAPSSCESGTCGTCRTRLVSGEADHRDLVLMDDEKAGQIMICVSRAVSAEIAIELIGPSPSASSVPSTSAPSASRKRWM